MAFRKGNISWNTGLKYTEVQKSKLNMDGLGLGKIFRKNRIFVNSYDNVHYWVRKNKGDACVCEKCGVSNKRLEWANIDHKYKHNLDDYFALCCKCHRQYDYANHLSNKGSRYGSIPNKMKGGISGV